MRSTWKIAASVSVLLTLLFVIVAVCVHFWFKSEGVQTLGNDIHAELSGKCYIIDPETKEIVDETNVRVQGSTTVREKYSDEIPFEGELIVAGYQNVADGVIRKTMSATKGQYGYWEISHIESCTHRKTENGITKDEEHICDYTYVYYLKPEFDDQVVVRIDSFENGALYAVRADTEQEALVRFDEFASVCLRHMET